MRTRRGRGREKEDNKKKRKDNKRKNTNTMKKRKKRKTKKRENPEAEEAGEEEEEYQDELLNPRPMDPTSLAVDPRDATRGNGPPSRNPSSLEANARPCVPRACRGSTADPMRATP